MRLDRYLSVEDGVLIGYLIGICLWAWASRDRSSSTSTRWEERDETVLTEEALCRLEDGETVKVERWHGHEVELSGALVVDADRLDANEPDAEGGSE